jgi:predicted esterase YcpF (UPF0227 family)
MRPDKLFFYFNGFNSAILKDFSGNRKITAVADFAVSRGYRFIPVSTCYRRAGAHCDEVLSEISDDAEEVVFCGSSMGGWFARILQLKLDQVRPGTRSAAIAFNPAYDLSMHGYLLLGRQVNFVTMEEYQWTSEHGAELRRLETSVEYGLTLPFFVYVDKGDEVIDWERSAAKHSPISRLMLFEGGCHSFDHFSEALVDFESGFTK